MAVEHLYRLDDVNTVAVSELLISGLSHQRVHMNRIHSLSIWMLVKNTTYSPEHMVHWLTEVFPTMGCDEYELVISNPIKFWMRVVLAYRMLHCIDNSVASYIDIIGIPSFLEKVIAAQGCRYEVILRNDRHCFSVKLLRVRRIDVIGPQSCLYMTDWNLKVETG